MSKTHEDEWAEFDGLAETDDSARLDVSFPSGTREVPRCVYLPENMAASTFVWVASVSPVGFVVSSVGVFFQRAEDDEGRMMYDTNGRVVYREVVTEPPEETK